MKTIEKIKISTVLVLLIVCGCKTVDLSIHDNSKSVSFNSNNNRQYVFVKHFSRDEKAFFLLYNLITAKDLSLDKIINEELKINNGDGIINLKIQGQDTFIDVIVSFIASQIVGMRTYNIQGDIFRYIDKNEPTRNSPQNKIDPSTGLPIKIEFDPETGLPKKE